MTRLIPFAALLLAAGAAVAQPEIAMEPESFNFGRITQGDRPSRTFSVRNIGDAPLTVRKVETDCGCTATEFAGSVIPPGDEAPMTVTFLSDGYEGRIGRTVTIVSDDPRRPVATIPVTGEVVAELFLDRRVVYLTGLVPGERRPIEATLVNASGHPVAILSAQASPSTLAVTAPARGASGPLATVEPGGSLRLGMTLTVPVLPPGSVVNGLLLLGTDHPRRPTIELVVTGFVGR